jgi:hypothetical protein
VNPCAVHREETHPAAIARRAGRPNNRRQNLGGGGAIPAWQRFTEAVQRGDLPVGPVDTRQVIAAIGAVQSLGDLAMNLSLNRSPARLRETGHKQWIITLV